MWQTFDADRAAVVSSLQAVFERLRAEETRFAWDKFLLDSAEPYTTAGKLFRGTLVLGAFRALNAARKDKTEEKPEQVSLEAVIAAATAIELYGSAILMQDDIMDQDVQRRGMQSIHVQVAEKARAAGFADPDHFGESLAICLADVLLFAAGVELTRAELPGDVRVQLQELAHRELRLLALAQTEDIRLAAVPIAAVTEEQIIAMFAAKTGRYSVQWSLQTAAVLAGVTVEIQQQLEKIGEEIGILYQLRDDYLGSFGDTTKTGKSTSGDIREGKKTLYHLYLARLSKSKKQQQALRIMGKSDASEAEITQLKAALQDLGVTAQVDAEIARRTMQARQLITNSQLNSETQALLERILEFVVTREK